jgi:hypothetical protein
LADPALAPASALAPAADIDEILFAPKNMANRSMFDFLRAGAPPMPVVKPRLGTGVPDSPTGKPPTGKPKGPYRGLNINTPDAPLTRGIDASLFGNDDGSVYFLHDSGYLTRMNDAPGASGAPRALRAPRHAGAPHALRHASFPRANPNNFFRARAHDGDCCAPIFGNDKQAPFGERPGSLHAGFDAGGHVRPLPGKNATPCTPCTPPSPVSPPPANISKK